ncbi:hypothetical protein BDFB_004601, partial [Asbolus verrucosus]
CAAIQPKKTVENSIILARKYKPKQPGGEKPNPEGYIHDHYSPKSSRKRPAKSRSVDADDRKRQGPDSLRADPSNDLRDRPVQSRAQGEAEACAPPARPARTKLKYSPPPEVRQESSAEHTEKLSPPGEWCGSNYSNIPVKCVRTRVTVSMFRGGMKLKERFILGVSVAAVLFTFLLVVDIQMDLGMSGHHLAPSHGRVKYVREEDAAGSAYNSFRKRFLQKTHRSGAALRNAVAATRRIGLFARGMSSRCRNRQSGNTQPKCRAGPGQI